ncbi:MAG: hypothetical protein A3E01_18545 [Gammaproteobacteria bacterium RIFCSPHIGHO2_12_FULL_63_22]|nr:MAG: hypothetical protein A3E01_18545 [Gammaproteobacteria bacterium RIFCSPHIGHO2_12_FULL_63_22]
MVKFTVDTAAKRFIAKPGITSFDVKIDLYSDAKEHWLAGGAAMGFDFPIRTIGGDPVGGGVFAGDLYFIRDGWKIRPDEVDHTLSVTGNLFLDAGETGEIFVPTVGDFTVLANMRNSNLVLAVSGGAGSTDWTSTERSQIRHRLGIDGSASAPAADPSLATAGDAMTLAAGAISEAAFAADARRYQVKVWMVYDPVLGFDRYLAVFYKDSKPVTTGIGSPQIQVIAAADGSTLFSGALSQIGSTGLYKRSESVNRMSPGAAYMVKVTATIDAASVVWYQPMSRDSAL